MSPLPQTTEFSYSVFRDLIMAEQVERKAVHLTIEVRQQAPKVVCVEVKAQRRRGGRRPLDPAERKRRQKLAGQMCRQHYRAMGLSRTGKPFKTSWGKRKSARYPVIQPKI